MKYKFLKLVLAMVLSFNTNAQQRPLQNFADTSLFNLNDSSCLNLSGEWLGEETEFTDSIGTIKGKYTCKMLFSQQGNMVSGISYIAFDHGKNYANLKIRGLVAGNKLYFEEYEIPEQKFIQQATLWCLRTGELDIKISGNQLLLEGTNYKGYADYYYFECGARASMELAKLIKPPEAKVIQHTLKGTGSGELQLRPNPAAHEVTVVFSTAEARDVQIDMYSLSGNLVANITNEFYQPGTHERLFDLSPYPAGAYLVRMVMGKQNANRILVIAR